MKPKHSLANQILGIGQYAYRNGQLYFVHGKTRIKVTEHFPVNGKTMETLIEDVIRYQAGRQDSAA